MRKRLFGPDGSSAPRPPLRARVADGLRTPVAKGAKTGGLPLSELMKRDWAAGVLSSRKVQEYCAGAALEGSTSPQVSALSNSGASGDQPSHMQRDMMRVLGRPLGAPELYRATLPICDRNGEAVDKLHPFLLPHERFAKLYAERRGFFDLHVQGDDRELQASWASLLQHKFVRGNPFVCGSSKDMAQQAIPIGLHGDAGAMSKQKSVLVLTWNSLVAQGSSKQTRHIITVIRKDQLLSNGATLDAIWDIISWSLNALATGKHPKTDHAGKPLNGHKEDLADQDLASGRRGVTLQMRGDWQWLCQCFGFPQWNCARNMCWICRAGNAQKPWQDFSQSAEWRGTVREHEQYIEDLAGSKLPRIFQIIGFRQEGVVIDVMHCVDLGVALHVIGNVFFEIVSSKKLGRTQADSVKELWRDLQAWYKKMHVPSRLSALKFEDFKQSGKPPKFRGKAANTRHLVPYVVKLCTQFDSGSEHDKFRLACATSLASFYGVLEACPQHMDVKSLREFAKLGREICSFYAALSARHDSKAWKLTPKFHLLLHLVELHAPRWGNPRFFWCYADEDLVGQIVEVAGSCHPNTMAEIALYKHCLLQSFV